jgi:hypothetical protein
MPQPQSFKVDNFKGLDEAIIPGPQSPITRETFFTRFLDNVKVRHGRIFGRDGLAKLEGITAQMATTPIIGLMPYIQSDLTTNLVRMSPTKIEVLEPVGNTWDDITGTDLTGASTDRPQWTNLDDTLIFVNDGQDRPRKYTGTGNTAEIASSSAPWAKAVEGYFGFLMLGNTSTDGSTFVPRQVDFADDWDTAASWSACDGNSLNLDETPGQILVLRTVGKILVAFKSDALIQIRWVGGQVRFSHEKIAFDKGIIAPLSVANVGERGLIFLGTDLELYITDGQTVTAFPPNLKTTLQETMNVSKAGDCVGVSHPDEETYHLFYNRTGGTWLDGRVSFNYRTGEFFKASYGGHNFVRAVAFRLASTSATLVAASADDDRVYQVDSGTDDDGTALTRSYETDWQNFRVPGEKYFIGASLTFAQARQTRVRIDVAKDGAKDFTHSRYYDLRGARTSADDVTIEYRLGSPILGTEFNLRTRFYHDGTASKSELKSILFHYTPVSTTPQEGHPVERGEKG